MNNINHKDWMSFQIKRCKRLQKRLQNDASPANAGKESEMNKIFEFQSFFCRIQIFQSRKAIDYAPKDGQRKRQPYISPHLRIKSGRKLIPTASAVFCLIVFTCCFRGKSSQHN